MTDLSGVSASRRAFTLPSSELGTDPGPVADLPKVTDAASYEAIPAGKSYVDPEGKTRTKGWRVTDNASYDRVPEGASYTDPAGATRTKPKYEGVNFSTQTLYDMAINDKERFNALARTYGKDTVKQDYRGELYVETEDGRRLKPGRGSLLTRAPAYAAAEAAPVVGATMGAVAGAPTVGGAVAGAGIGSASGQFFNDAILSLAGIYDRSATEQGLNVAGAGLAGSAGEVVGRGVGAAVPLVRGLAKKGQEFGSALVGDIVGAYQVPGAVEQAARLAGKGVMVRPSAWMSEAPFIKSLVEEFDPVFRQQKVLRQSAQQHYESEGERIAEQLGIDRSKSEPLTEATARPSSEPAGRAVLSTVREEMHRQDSALLTATENARVAARNRAAIDEQTHAKALELLTTAHEEATAAAQAVVDEGFASLRTDADAAIRAAKAGENPGDLVRAMSQKIRGFRAAIGQRAKILYDSADAAAGDVKPTLQVPETTTKPATNLQDEAKLFLEQLPKPFRDKYPDIVNRLTLLEDGKTTFAQLRNLRSLIRSDIDYNDLLPSFREGTFSRFEDTVDRVLHNSAANPALKPAIDLLDKADAFYAKNIKTFKHEGIQNIIRFMDSGMPPDPKTLASTLFQKDNAEFIDRARKIAGKPLWGAVQAADTQAIFDASKSLTPGMIDGKAFAQQVLQRERDGILGKAYDPTAAGKLTTQAQRVLAGTEGRLDIALAPGDTLAVAMRRAEEAKAAIEDLAKHDPLTALQTELKKIDADFATQSKAVQDARKADPLKHLYDPTALAMESAERILRSPDMLMAAAARFGEGSQEFTMLRQVAALRWLQRTLPSTAFTRRTMEKALPEDIQHLLFPGVTHNAMITLAKDMEFLLGGGVTDVGGSIAAKARVLHPITGKIPLVSAVPKFLGLDFAARFTLGKFYAAVTKAVTHPAFINWVAKGLRSRAPGAREMVRAEFQRAMQMGGATGAAIGEQLYQSPEEGGPVDRKAVGQ